MESGQIEILLGDDHENIRASIKALLEDEPDINVVGEAENGAQVISLVKSLPVDVVLLDIKMPILDGFKTMEYLVEKYPEIKILMHSIVNDKAVISRARELGAHGYLVKTSSWEEVLEAIRSVVSGKCYFKEENITEG